MGGKYWDENHANMRTFKSTLCHILINQRRFFEAERILVKLIEYREAANDGALSIKSVDQHLELAQIYGETGRQRLALDILKKIDIKIMQETLRKDKTGSTPEETIEKINLFKRKYSAN